MIGNFKFYPKQAVYFNLRRYDEDGAQWNFIRDTETNASCPCTIAYCIVP